MFSFTPDSPWVVKDNRRLRELSRITAGSLNAKMQAALPPEFVKGATVLDLGSCIGAAGKWSLSHGAARYVGVEVQREYYETARSLLDDPRAEFLCADLVEFLEGNTARFDVIVLAGVLFGFIDPFWVLRLAARHSDCVVVESMYPVYMRSESDLVMQFMPEQPMILPGTAARHLHGWGARLSPKALDLVMANLGFDSEAIKVPPSVDCDDAYNIAVPDGAGVVERPPLPAVAMSSPTIAAPAQGLPPGAPPPLAAHMPMPNIRPQQRLPFRFIRRYRRGAQRTLSVAEEISAGLAGGLARPFNSSSKVQTH